MTNLDQSNVIQQLKYYQKILHLNIEASEQFDTKLLTFPTYYNYNPENRQFTIELISSVGLKFLDRIKKMQQEESIAVTIRYEINYRSYPILIAFTTDDSLNDTGLVINDSKFKLHIPSFEELGFEVDEITTISQKIEDELISNKVKIVTTELTNRFPNVAIIPNQFMCGVVNITSFDKIIKDKIDYWLTKPEKIKESDIMFKYLNGKLASKIPTKIRITPIIEGLDPDQKEAVETFFGTRLQTLNGPPGTGKSQTITEFLLQAILRDEKVLVTSYNNKPVDVVYKKLQKALGQVIPFPLFTNDIQGLFKEYVVYVNNLKLITTPKKQKDLLQKLEEEYEKITEEYNIIETFEKTQLRIEKLNLKIKEYASDEPLYQLYLEELEQKHLFVKNSQSEYDKKIKQYQNNIKVISILSKDLILAKLNNNLINIYERDLEVLEDASINPKRIYQARKVLEDLIDNSLVIFGNILKSINNLPTKKNYFDYILVDEASQCNQIAIVPLLYSSRALIVVGDPLQLQHIPGQGVNHIVNLSLAKDLSKEGNNNNFNYVDTSLFNYVDKMRQESNQKELFLSYHYRCHPQIIDFSNQYFYNNRLKIQQKQPNYTGISWYDIKGQANTQNTNTEEAKMVVARVMDYLTRTEAKNIGVISQYRNQTYLIKRILNSQQVFGVSVGTVHTFQGDEKKVILYSPVYSEGTTLKQMDFVNLNQTNILNVAISRGMEYFEVIGDRDFALNNYRTEKDLYYSLAKYIIELDKPS